MGGLRLVATSRPRSFNSATAHHRGNGRFHSLFPLSLGPFNSATAHHRGNGIVPTPARGAPGAPSIRPRLITVEMGTAHPQEHALRPAFNSATAHHRGNGRKFRNCSPIMNVLQFGHGSSPWKWSRRSPKRDASTSPSIRPRLITVEMDHPRSQRWERHKGLQFGHGSSPWKWVLGRHRSPAGQPPSIRPRLITVEMGPFASPAWRRATLPLHLQFGHGSSPWKWPKCSLRRHEPDPTFNSATAHHRGNGGRRLVGGPAGSVTFNSATAHHRGNGTNNSDARGGSDPLQFGHGSSPWKWRTAVLSWMATGGTSPSIRPRLITVEMAHLA